MKSIWKFKLYAANRQEVEMPAGARLLSVQVQDSAEGVMLWALVDPAARLVRRSLRMYGTGHRIDEPGLPFVGTFQLQGGALVFHLFDGGEGGLE